MASMVTDKAELVRELLSHREYIMSLGVKQVGLFGSFARDSKISKVSDVDLLVEFDPAQKTFDNFMALSFFLEEILGRKVDIVTPQSLSKYIGPHILNQVEDVFA